MVQFLSIIFFLGFLQFLLGFSKVPVFFLCHPVYVLDMKLKDKVTAVATEGRWWRYSSHRGKLTGRNDASGKLPWATTVRVLYIGSRCFLL